MNVRWTTSEVARLLIWQYQSISWRIYIIGSIELDAQAMGPALPCATGAQLREEQGWNFIFQFVNGALISHSEY